MADLEKVNQLCQFCWDGDVAQAKVLVEELSIDKINTPNSRGQSALYCAARNGKEAILELLFTKKGLNLNIQVASHGGTPLHASGYNGHALCTAMLLMNGADPLIKNSSGAAARDEAKNDAIDVYFIFDYSGIPGLIEKYPQYATYTKKKKYASQASRAGLKNSDTQNPLITEKSVSSKSVKLSDKESSSVKSKRRGSDTPDKEGSKDSTGTPKEVKARRRKSIGNIESLINQEKKGEDSEKLSRREIKKRDSKQMKSEDSSSAIVPANLKKGIKVFSLPNSTDTLATMQALLDFDNKELKDRGKKEVLVMPYIIDRSIKALLQKGLNSEGLFRVPGCKTTMDTLEQTCNEGNSTTIDFMNEEPADIASFLKKYLRDVPDRPLFTKELEPEFAAITDEIDENTTEVPLSDQVAKFRSCYDRLPLLNQCVVERLLFLLSQVVRNEYVNRMTLDAVSIVFGQMSGILCTSTSSKIVNWSIENYQAIFGEKLEEKESILHISTFTSQTKAVVSLFQSGDHSIFIEAGGNAKIIHRLNQLLVREFSFGCDIDNLIVNDERIFFIVSHDNTTKIKSCPVNDLIMSTPDQFSYQEIPLNEPQSLLSFEKRLFLGKNSFSEVIGEEIKELIPAPSQPYKFLSLVGSRAYGFNKESIDVWDITNATKLHSFPLVNEEVSCITVIDNQLWVVTYINNTEHQLKVFSISDHELNSEIAIKSLSKITIFPTTDYIWVGTSERLYVIDKVTNLRINFPEFSNLTLLSIEESKKGYNIWLSNSFKDVLLYYIANHRIEEAFVAKINEQLSTQMASTKNIFETTQSIVYALSRYNKELALSTMSKFMKSLVTYQRKNSPLEDGGCKLCKNKLLWPVSLDCSNSCTFCFSCLFHQERDNGTNNLCSSCNTPYRITVCLTKSS